MLFFFNLEENGFLIVITIFGTSVEFFYLQSWLLFRQKAPAEISVNLTHAESVIKQAASSEGVGAQGESADLPSILGLPETDCVTLG